MSESESHDDQMLRELDWYEAAIARVADDFAARKARTAPVGVMLDSGDVVAVTYHRPGGGPASLTLPYVDGLESAVVALAELLQEKEFGESDNTWPGCLPGHHHPPVAAVVDGSATWCCPASSAVVAAIGDRDRPRPR